MVAFFGNINPDVFPFLLILCGLAIPLAAIIGGTVLLGLRILKGQGSKKQDNLQMDEVRMIQEIHRGLSRLEDRVEALETILLEKEKEKEGTKSYDRQN